MDSMTSLRVVIRSEIEASGRTQADVCTAVGITQKHLSMFLRGKAGMQLDMADRVLAELGRELVLSTWAQLPDEGGS